MKNYPNYRPTRFTAVRPGGFPRSAARALAIPRPGNGIPIPRMPRFSPWVGTAIPAAWAAWELWKWLQERQQNQSYNVTPAPGWVRNPALLCTSPPAVGTGWFGPHSIGDLTYTAASCGQLAVVPQKTTVDPELDTIGNQAGAIWYLRYRYLRDNPSLAGTYRVGMHSTWEKPNPGAGASTRFPPFINGVPSFKNAQPLPATDSAAPPMPASWPLPGWTTPLPGRVPWWQLKGFRHLRNPPWAPPEVEVGNQIGAKPVPRPVVPPRNVVISAAGAITNHPDYEHENRRPPKRQREVKTRARKAVAAIAMFAFAATEALDLLDILVKNIGRRPRLTPDKRLRMEGLLKMARQRDYAPHPTWAKPWPRERLDQWRRALREYDEALKYEGTLPFNAPLAKSHQIRPDRWDFEELPPKPKGKMAQRAWAVENWDHVRVDDFVEDVILNEVQDWVIGRAAGGAGKFLSQDYSKPYAPVPVTFGP